MHPKPLTRFLPPPPFLFLFCIIYKILRTKKQYENKIFYHITKEYTSVACQCKKIHSDRHTDMMGCMIAKAKHRHKLSLQNVSRDPWHRYTMERKLLCFSHLLSLSLPVGTGAYISAEFKMMKRVDRVVGFRKLCGWRSMWGSRGAEIISDGGPYRQFATVNL